MLAIVDLLGADNLDDETLAVLERLWRRRGQLDENMSGSERTTLRRAIHRFTIRRTKADLNRLISASPDRYLDESGRPCRYPRHKAIRYPTGETPEDKSIALQIREVAGRLQGMARLQATLEVSDAQRRDGVTDEVYLAWRLRGAAALAAHQIMAGLRSSRARLLEHLKGTAAVLELEPALTSHGSRPGTIAQLHSLSGRVPEVRLHCQVPPWLTDSAAHARVVEEELATYQELWTLALQLSTSRETAKADLLRQLAREHRLVIAFDTHLITLRALALHLGREIDTDARTEVMVVTSDETAARKKLLKSYCRSSESRDMIALCSDALSEGINLQGASVVVLLDQPTVIRVAEQRIGRIDRMDSPHEEIEAYWPDDSPEFALRAGERFVERYRFVEDYLGSNIRLPDGMGSPQPSLQDGVVSVDEDIRELERRATQGTVADDLQDAFAPVRALVQGDSALVTSAIYESVRRSSATVLSSISAVESSEEFAFVAVKGTEYGAPRWVFLAHPGAPPITDLDLVSERLRQHLKKPTRDCSWDERAAVSLERVLSHLEQNEEVLLPRGKRRAISEMRLVLDRYRRMCSRADGERESVLRYLAELSAERAVIGVDLVALSEWWLDVIQPVRHRYLQSRRRTKPLLLRDLRKELTAEPLSTEVLRTIYERDLSAQPLGERVAAVILGLPSAHP